MNHTFTIFDKKYILKPAIFWPLFVIMLVIVLTLIAFVFTGMGRLTDMVIGTRVIGWILAALIVKINDRGFIRDPYHKWYSNVVFAAGLLTFCLT